MTGPLIVGIGGTPRPGSSTERALILALRQAEAGGARTKLFGGEFLERLPHFNPGPAGPSAQQAELAEAVRDADGIILATPGYHGSLSGVVKNALDTTAITGAFLNSDDTALTTNVFVTDPRLFGVRITKNW